MNIDVIIPVYRPDEKFNMLMKMLGMQTLLPSNILIANTVDDEDTSEEIGALAKKLLGDPQINVTVTPVQKKDFDHALTRDAMAGKSKADAILFMTQDAVPKDADLLRNLADAIEKGADAAFARQVANSDAGVTERLTRSFNYPGTSYVRTSEDFDTYGIKTVFCSDTCMMYKRETFERLGRFGESSMFAEDMTFAFKLLKNGGKLAYVSEACVFHSHDLSLKENYKRSFAMGINQAKHPEIYKKLSSEKEGMKYVKYVAKSLFKEGKPLKIFYFLLSCGARYLGVLKGRRKK